MDSAFRWRVRLMNRIGYTNLAGWILFLFGIGCIAFSNCHQRKSEIPVGSTYLGQLEIPQIDVNLPIYEGVTDTVLENGVGHLSESSGFGAGIGSRCILAGHRGLPNQTLLIRLGEVKIGDQFVIKENQTYFYRVCDIQVIHPEDTQCLKTKAEKELVSLITCTPVGINTHRLVVTGERIK